ncbi:MAG: hypothetical protein JWP69_970 [Flaviaesturariibacter sp.]|nr:hypothetical protein [Flaviaesturariibacter sp.]
MSSKPDIKAFRIGKSDEAFEMATLAIDKGFFNSAASSLYYTCFYLISALLVEHDLSVTTHAGLKTLFGLKFVKEGLIDKKWSKLLTTLFDRRHESDYEDFFIMSEKEVRELYKEVVEFRIVLKDKLEVS